MQWDRTLVRVANAAVAEGLPMPTRPLGKTGWNVSQLSLGGQGSLEQQGGKDNCIAIINRANDLGINYFDTAPMYGPSEEYYGEAMKGWRDTVFLATKTDERTRDGSLRQLEQSLNRLKTDYVDLWQLHAINSKADLKAVLKKDGSMDALVEMYEEGVVRHVGITGHEDPKLLLALMEEYEFDTVLCPVNPADASTKNPFDGVVRTANEKEMGVIGMKVFAQGYIFHPDGITTSWEPICYALTCDVSTIIVGHDTPEQLEQNVAIAKSFRRLNFDEMRGIMERAKPFKERGAFFRKEFGGYASQKKHELFTMRRFEENE